MKANVIFYLMVFIIISGCTQQKSTFPQGAWQLVQWQNVSGNLTETLFPGQYTGSGIKMWSENHFLTVGRFQVDTTFIDNYIGGTYTLEGDRYEEDRLYHVNTNAVGENIEMSLELRNDTLVQTYGYQVEKYIRLK